MRSFVGAVAFLGLAACPAPPGNVGEGGGTEMTQFFDFEANRVQSWEYINLSDDYGYALLADMSDIVEDVEEGQVFSVTWTTECRSSGSECISGPTHTVKWRSTPGDGVFITELVYADGTSRVFSPPITVAAEEMKPEETVETITGGGTWTSTYHGFEDCPIRMSGSWEGACVRFTVSDGDADPLTNPELTGEIWGIRNYNLVGFQRESDAEVWEMSDYTCVGDEC